MRCFRKMRFDKDFTVYFVRHAQSCGNADIPYTHEYHQDDPPLSPLGIIQAELLGASALTDRVDKIFSSTLIRTVQTAYPTAVKLNKEIIMLPDLMETDTRIAGTDIERLKKDYPLAVPCRSEPSPTGGGLFLGEDTQEMRVQRAGRCMKYFYDVARDGDTLMVVSHGSYFGYLLRAALSIDIPETFCWQVDNCCVTSVIFRKNGIPKLSFANYTGHLTNI